jgi:hypothetical protein
MTAAGTDPGILRLVKLAWRTVPAAEANSAIERARRATGRVEAAGAFAAGEHRGPAGRPDADADTDANADTDAGNPDEGSEPMEHPARACELVFAPDATFQAFAEQQLPRLVYHLESIGAHLPKAAGVVICLFLGDELHFIRAADFVAEVCAQLGVSAEELVRRHGTGELRTAVRGPLAKPPG